MFNKKYAAAIAAMAMAASLALSASPAQAAATPSLTYAEFLASPGYATLGTYVAGSKALILASPSVSTQTTLRSDAGGYHYMFSMGLWADATKSSAYFSFSTADTNPTNYQVYYTGSQYISTISALQQSQEGITNLSQALAMLHQPNAVAVSSSAPLAGLPDTNPSKVFGDKAQDPLGSVTLDKLAMTFSPVDCQPMVSTPTSTECSFAASVVSAALGQTIKFDFTMDFDATGLETNSTIVESTDALGTLLSIDTQQTLRDSYTQVLPTNTLTVDMASLTKANNKYSATKVADSKTTLIAAKAKALSQKAKKPVTTATLVAAAKALKLKVQTFRLGIKFTASWYGETSAMCVTAINGKISRSAC